jgi:glycosyltransferase involved in cell wall biosynthesis
MLKNLVRPAQIETVYCPIDLGSHESLSAEARREVRLSLGAADDTPLVGLVGNICPRKGHDILIRSLPALLKKHPKLRLAVVGNPFKDYATGFRKLADKLGVGGAIDWTGFRRDIPQVMAALDVLAVPSRSEPFGLTAVEALAVGTPVVASRVGGLPETVDHEQTGLLIPPRHPRALAEAIDRLVSDADFHQRCSRAARIAIAERYDPERLWTRIEEILVKVASRRAAGGRAA